MKLFKSTQLLLASSLLCCLPVLAQADNDPIRIGSFLAVTGPASFLGDPELKTLKLYIDEVNAKGGIDGRMVELIHYDTSGKAKEAVSFTKRLVQKDRVDIIVGGSASGTTLAAMPVIEKAQVPFISLAGSVKIIEPVQKWTFKMPHTDRMAAAKIPSFLRLAAISMALSLSPTRTGIIWEGPR